MEQEAAEIVGEVGEADFRLGACGSDGANEQAHPVFLRGEDMLDAGADGGFSRMGLSAVSAQTSEAVLSDVTRLRSCAPSWRAASVTV